MCKTLPDHATVAAQVMMQRLTHATAKNFNYDKISVWLQFISDEALLQPTQKVTEGIWEIRF